ncbi:MAG: type II secretion system protein, partial [Patescibacteria group bacterium]
MRKLPSFFKKFASASQKGFTLIELLVVIGILGVLVSALVATINPFEQIKKGDDATLKNVAAEMQTATLRYYTTHGGLPWDAVLSGGDTNCTAEGAVDGNKDIPVATQLNSANFN